jgi:shikimate dehydrogenase
MADSRETAHAFVVGSPIRHSRSPIIHRHWLRRFGIDGSYTAIDVPETQFVGFIDELKRGRQFRGGNVTIPHKEHAYRLVDQPDDLAQELGAANTVWLEEGLLKATNSDGFGFTANLDDRASGWDKATHAVILGAGGASRAIIQAVRNRGIAEIHVVNRTLSRAEELADRFGARVHAHPMEALQEVMQGAGLFINTTSLGMDGEPSIDIDFAGLITDAVVTDIVYVPLETPVLAKARSQGLKTVDGLGMLLHQAVPGFEKWFGRRPTVDAELRDLVIQDMERHG